MKIENRTKRIIHLNVEDKSQKSGYACASFIPGDIRRDAKVAEANEVSDVLKKKLQACAENAMFFAGDDPDLVCHGGALNFPQRKAA